MTLLYVTVVGNLGPAAAGAKGYWVPTGWLTAAADMRVIPPAPLPPFTIAPDGSFTSGPLLAQDSPGVQPQGEAWTLSINGIDQVAPFSQTYEILHANGASQDLADLGVAVPDPQFTTYLLAANNLSDVDDAATALANLGGASAADLTAETTRAEAAEGTLAAGVAANATAIAAETTRAEGAETTLAGGISANATAIAAETTRAETAEGTLLPKAGGTVTGQFTLTARNTWDLDAFSGTDDQKMTSALAAITAAKSGTLLVPARTVTLAGQVATSLASTLQYLRIRGQGAGPATGDAAPIAATVMDLQYAGSGAAKMDFHHNGTIALEDISFKDTSGSAVPFFQCTNPSPKLRRLGFTGSKTMTACNQDAILLGGTNPAHNHTDFDDAPFQGYQGVLEDITFWGIRTGAWARTFANSISMRDLSFDGSCGSPNLFTVTDGAMTAASAVLTCATSAPFTSGMVGQVILVQGAGQANRNSWLIAVITVFTSSTQVTLSCAASTTVTAANVCAPVASAIQLGMSGTPGGVEGCVIDDCCIEVSNYAIGVLLNQSTGNAITATALWDGTTGSFVGVGAVGLTSTGNYIHLTECGITAGGASFATDKLGNFFGTDTIIAPNGPNPVVQMPGLQLNGSEPLNLLGIGGTAGSSLAFGPAGGPADTFLYRDAAGSLNGQLAAAGTPLYKFLATAIGAEVGQATNFANLGPLSTSDIWLTTGGSNGNINLNLRASGSGILRINSKAASVFAGTPAISVNAAAGTGATASIVGNDQRGTITVNTGGATGSIPTAGDLATITYTATGGTFPTTPIVVVCGDSLAAAALDPGTSNRTTAVFHLQAGQAPAASTTYTFNYIALG